MTTNPTKMKSRRGLWGCDDDDEDVLRPMTRVLPVGQEAAVPELLGKNDQKLYGKIGPPGTGKTTQLVAVVEDERAKGTPWDEICLIAFTKAAADEAKERVHDELGAAERDLVHFRTLHSLCWSLLGRRGIVLDEAHLRAFAKQHSYRMSGSLPRNMNDFIEQLGQKVTEDDALLAIYEWSRARRISLKEAHGRFPLQVSFERLERFVERYDKYRIDSGIVDYTDMLENVLAFKHELPVIVAIVDEAQDLTPLQAAVVEQVFARCTRVYAAADDDQCIYTWAGADPAWVQSFFNRCTSVEQLPQSYRVPAAVHAVAQRIIRQNKNRVPKQYLPRTGSPGKVSHMSMSGALDYIVRSPDESFVLARNSIYLRSWSRVLLEHGVPFLVEGPAGQAAQKALDGVHAAVGLQMGKDVLLQDVVHLLDFIPSRGGDLLPHGTKATIERMLKAKVKPTVSRDELMLMGLGKLLAHLDDVGPVEIMSRLPGRHREHLHHLLRKNNGIMQKPRITLSTIHRAKGQECKNVVVIPDMTTASFNEYIDGGQEGRENEHRVAYVAVTRTIEHLIFVPPNGRRHFPYEDFVQTGS